MYIKNILNLSYKKLQGLSWPYTQSVTQPAPLSLSKCNCSINFCRRSLLENFQRQIATASSKMWPLFGYFDSQLVWPWKNNEPHGRLNLSMLYSSHRLSEKNMANCKPFDSKICSVHWFFHLYLYSATIFRQNLKPLI